VRPVTLAGRDATLAGIRDRYPFWTVEYLYSYGQLMGGSLASAYANYLTSPAGTETMARFEYFVCDLSVAELCSSGR
jgi:phosphate transport system substrate-binding protein